jgi:hypothetical protein
MLLSNHDNFGGKFDSENKIAFDLTAELGKTVDI